MRQDARPALVDVSVLVHSHLGKQGIYEMEGSSTKIVECFFRKRDCNQFWNTCNTAPRDLKFIF